VDLIIWGLEAFEQLIFK